MSQTVPDGRYDVVMAQAKASLTGMIRRKDPAGITALRSVIAALENAGAVPQTAPSPSEASAIAGAMAFGAAETPRRHLSGDEVDQILAQEMASRAEQATMFDRLHRDLEAAMARYQASLVGRLLAGELSPG